MPITYIDSSIQALEASNPQVTIDSTGATIIVAFAAAEGISGFTGVTDSQSNTYTAVGGLQANTGGRLQCYVATTPTNSSSLVVTLSMSSGSNTNWIFAAAFKGTTGTPYYGANSTGSAGFGLSFTPTYFQDAIIACGFDHTGTGITGYGTGQIEMESSTSGGDELAVTAELYPGTSANSQSFTGAEKISGLILNAANDRLLNII